MIRTADQIRAELVSLRTQAKKHDRIHNEGSDGYNPHLAAIRSLEDELDRVAEDEFKASVAIWRAEEEALWTLEVTQQRRAAWNAWVRSHAKPIPAAAVANRVKEQGWSIEALQRAITRHSL